MYVVISELLYKDFLGDWLFSRAAFPESNIDPSNYLCSITRAVQHYTTLHPFRWMTAPFLDLGDSCIHEIFLQMRENTAAFVCAVAMRIVDLRPRMVGCSSTFQQHCSSLAVLRKIKELNPAIITFIGGANCEEQMGLATHTEFPWVDFVISGEADDIIVDFCQNILDAGRDVDPSRLPYGAIAPANRNTKIIPPRANVKHLDSVPVPDYDDYFTTLHSSAIAKYITPGLSIETARGCWWGQKHHCTFCGLNGSSMTFRSKSPTRVIEEMKQLSERYANRRFQVVDNIIDMSYVKSVLPMLTNNKESYAIFYETKANLKRSHVQQFAQAGVRWVQPGIESLHDEALKLLDKGTTTWLNVQLLKWCREYGINAGWNFLFGIPGEDDEWYNEITSWLPLIFHLQPPSGMSKIRIDRFSPYFKDPSKWGMTLLPSQKYSYIYPLSQDKLRNLVYVFDACDETDGQPINKDDGEGASGRGAKELRVCIEQWRKCFYSAEYPMLSMNDDGESLTITDSRPCATDHVTLLKGLSYCVYKICERAVSRTGVLRKVRTEHGISTTAREVEQVVRELCSRKIMIDLNGRLLSLAISEHYVELPKMSEVPVGYIDIETFRRDKARPINSLAALFREINALV